MRSIFKKRHTLVDRVFSLFLSFTFIFSLLVPPSVSRAQGVMASVLSLPPVGTMVTPTAGFTPALMTGITIHPENPLMFDFIIEEGDRDLEGEQLRDQSQKLIKYFLAALTVPEKELWVNLSPYEKERIIPEGFGDTEMGRDLLAQDYLLKQLAASLMYPEDELGKEFWGRVYQKANELYGTTEIPLNTFNKIWIVPEKAVVLEHGNTAFVVESHLKVMLEEDYVALKNNLRNAKFGLNHVEENDAGVISGVTSDVVREVLIPAIEEEVNKGETFANLRQVYHSMILATWYKKNLRDSLLGQVYADQNKTKGIDTGDKEINQKIYNQYIEAFQKGVYNYIRKDYDEASKRTIPRKYFSGGFDGEMLSKTTQAIKFDELPTSSPARVIEALRHRDILSTEDRAAFDRQIGQLPTAVQQNIFHQAATPGGDRDNVRIVLVENPNSKGFDQGVRVMSSPVQEEVRSYTGARKSAIEKQIGQYRSQRIPFISADERFLSDNLAPAWQYLKEQLIPHISKEYIRNVYIIKSPSVNFGIFYLRNELYIEEPFLQEIDRMGNPAGMRIRVFIHALTKYWEYDKRKAEYEYIKQYFPEKLENILPQEGATIESVLAKSKGDILDIRDAYKIRQTLGLGEEFEIQLSRDPLTGQLFDELAVGLEEALYKRAIAVVNGEINLKKRARLKTDDLPLSAEEKKEKITISLFAGAFDPLSEAHYVNGMLKGAAESYADVQLALATKGDFRKLHLTKTKDIRLKNLQDFVSDSSGSLIQAPPYLEEDNKLDAENRGLNGEEKILPVIKLNKDYSEITVWYGTGGDHYFSFKRDTKGKVLFAKIDENNIEDFRYYIKLERYSELLKKLQQIEGYSIPDEYKAFIQELVTSQNPESFLAVGKYFPVLETVGKLWLIQGELDAGGINAKVGMLYTTRGSDPLDPLRDQLAIPIIRNQGLKYDIDHPEGVSSTRLREGLARLAQDGIFDVDLFAAFPVSLLKKILVPENRDYLYMLINAKKRQLAKSLSALLPANFVAEEGYRQTIKNRLVQQLSNYVDNVKFRETERYTNPTVLEVFSWYSDEPLVTLRYSVNNFFNGSEIFIEERTVNAEIVNEQDGRKMIELLIGYAKDFNHTQKLASSPLQEETAIAFDEEDTLGDQVIRPRKVGGIDLNPALLDLQIKRDGNGVPLPLPQQPIGQMHIEGFVPVIINIELVPATPLPFLSGSGEPEDGSQDLSFYSPSPINRISRLVLSA